MASSWCPWSHPPLAISTPTFYVFFGTLHKSIAITQPFSIYIGRARSAMATVARTMRQPKSKRQFFFQLNARVTPLVARSAASRMLGYTCELEIKHYHRTFPSTHAHYNSYSLLVPSSTFPTNPQSFSALPVVQIV